MDGVLDDAVTSTEDADVQLYYQTHLLARKCFFMSCPI